jgi:hypothetical protein
MAGAVKPMRLVVADSKTAAQQRVVPLRNGAGRLFFTPWVDVFKLGPDEWRLIARITEAINEYETKAAAIE